MCNLRRLGVRSTVIGGALSHPVTSTGQGETPTIVSLKERSIATVGTLLDTFRLDGRVALITGGAGGLGIVFAEALAQAGADVVLMGRRLAPVQEVAERVAAETGRRALGLSGDVTKLEDMQSVVDQVLEQFGRLDILVNNAGINIRKPTIEFPLEDWHAVVDTSLTGTFIGCKVAAPAMIKAGWGRIINVSSMFGQVGVADRPAYTAAKGGMIQLTRTLALEWARYGVNVNALAPGPFFTEMNKPLMNDPEKYQWFVDRLPIGRWGQPSELAGAIVFLSSEAASFMTGATLTIDGGWTAQ